MHVRQPTCAQPPSTRQNVHQASFVPQVQRQEHHVLQAPTVPPPQQYRRRKLWCSAQQALTAPVDLLPQCSAPQGTTAPALTAQPIHATRASSRRLAPLPPWAGASQRTCLAATCISSRGVARLRFWWTRRLPYWWWEPVEQGRPVLNFMGEQVVEEEPLSSTRHILSKQAYMLFLWALHYNSRAQI